MKFGSTFICELVCGLETWIRIGTKCSHVNWISAQFEALEQNFFSILMLWSLRFLEICDFGVKVESWESLKHTEMGA